MMIGRLNRRLVYQEPADGATDPLNQVAEAWTTVATVWGELRAPTGKELVNAGQLQSAISHTITVRRARGWFPSPSGRFLYSSPSWNTTPRVFNVVAAFDPDEGNTWVSVLATEQTAPAEA